MGRIVYLDVDGNRSEVTSESIKYSDDHWKLVVDEHEKEDTMVAEMKYIPRERVVEVETEREIKESEGGGVYSLSF
jgi:hypothetical protein